MSDSLNLFIPLYKIDEEQREVWGIATHEIKDADGEVMDYDKSLPHFMQWSEDANRRSGGKSNGNVREMHQPRAVGKVLKLIPDDTNKKIHVGVKVVDDAAWQKCVEGVYTGFSVGGRYGQRWLDKDANGGRCMRYEALPFEISLVDLPAVPTATFEMVKADGTHEVRQFKSLLYSSSDDGTAGVTMPSQTSSTATWQLGETSQEEQPPEWLSHFTDLVGKLTSSVNEASELLKADKAEREKILSELSSRGASVGIARKDDEPMTPPKGYPSDWKLYGDPANWSWPCDEPGRCSSACSYYNAGNGKDKYSPKEWAILGRRIARLATEHGGSTYVYRPESKTVERKEEKMAAIDDLKKDFPQLLGDLRTTLGQAVDSLASDPDSTRAMLTQALAALDVAGDAQRANPSDKNPSPPNEQAIESLKGTGTSMTSGGVTSTGTTTTAGSHVPTADIATPTAGSGVSGTGYKAETPVMDTAASSPSSPSSPSSSETETEDETESTEKAPMTTPTASLPTLSTTAMPAPTVAPDVAALKAEIVKDLGALIKDAVKEVLGVPAEVATKSNMPLGDLNAIVGAPAPDEALEALRAGGPGAYRKAVEIAGSEGELRRRASDAVVHSMVGKGVVTSARFKVMDMG